MVLRRVALRQFMATGYHQSLRWRGRETISYSWAPRPWLFFPAISTIFLAAGSLGAALGMTRLEVAYKRRASKRQPVMEMRSARR
jgi:hypothetical protein